MKKQYKWRTKWYKRLLRKLKFWKKNYYYPELMSIIVDQALAGLNTKDKDTYENQIKNIEGDNK